MKNLNRVLNSMNQSGLAQTSAIIGSTALYSDLSNVNVDNLADMGISSHSKTDTAGIESCESE